MLSLNSESCRYPFWPASVSPPRSGRFDDESGIAETQKPGHVEFNSSSGEYAISGAGNLGGTSDGFHYVWKKVTGDVVISADTRFSGAGNASDRKAALMIRQSLDSRAIYAAAVLHSDGSATLQYRPDLGAISKSSEVAKTDLSSTVYMTLQRKGDSFTMWAGKRGKMGGPLPFSPPITVTMNGPVYVGLAAASSDLAAKDAAVFSNVYVQPVKTP